MEGLGIGSAEPDVCAANDVESPARSGTEGDFVAASAEAIGEMIATRTEISKQEKRISDML